MSRGSNGTELTVPSALFQARCGPWVCFRSLFVPCVGVCSFVDCDQIGIEFIVPRLPQNCFALSDLLPSTMSQDAKMRRSNVVFGDPRPQYNQGLWVSATKSTQSSVAQSSKGSEHIRKLKEEREKTAQMKRALQASSLQLGNSQLTEKSWKSTSHRPEFSAEQRAAARGQLDPAVARRIKVSKYVFACNRGLVLRPR